MTISGGTGWVLNPDTDAPEEAWALLAFMNGKEQLDALQTFQPRHPRPRRRADPQLAVPDRDLADAAADHHGAPERPALQRRLGGDPAHDREPWSRASSRPEDAMAQYKASVIDIVGEENTVSKL